MVISIMLSDTQSIEVRAICADTRSKPIQPEQNVLVHLLPNLDRKA